MDTNGFLATIGNPLGDDVSATYNADGLMLSYRDERLFTATMTYDSLGRLMTDIDGAGALQSLTPSGHARNWQTKATSGEGRSTNYLIETLSSGEKLRTSIFPMVARQLKRSGSKRGDFSYFPTVPLLNAPLVPIPAGVSTRQLYR